MLLVVELKKILTLKMKNQVNFYQNERKTLTILPLLKHAGRLVVPGWYMEIPFRKFCPIFGFF